MKISDPIVSVKGIGESMASKYAAAGIRTIGDLAHYYPRNYEDFSVVQKISEIKPGPVSIMAKIIQVKGRYVRRGMHITEAVASDETGSVRLVWFNQPYREGAIKGGAEYYISGKFELSYQRLSIMNPAVELVSEFPVSTARIVPVYRESAGLKSAAIRKAVKNIKGEILEYPEILPDFLIQNYNLMSAAEARLTMHFPDDTEKLSRAEYRLGFEEMFELALAGLMNRQQFKSEKTIAIKFDEKLAKKFVSKLPFNLTDSQRSAMWQILKDIAHEKPMNRLLQGDVGSGKTVVAAMAGLMVIKNGYQVAMMAPTELLASQHAQTLHKLFRPLGVENNVGLITGSMAKKQKKTAAENIKSGNIKFVIGTHSLIQESILMNNLGLVIVDEQHRFGVDQRKILQSKAGRPVHILNMSATPIPRTLALTLYGELDITNMKSKPSERKEVITRVFSQNSKPQLYREIDREIEKGKQVFVVTPLIQESEKLNFTDTEKAYKELSEGALSHRRIAILHGRQKTEDKAKIMEDFVNHKYDILVSTTVIEVGVDVPNASVMLIENAERFGLAQIHQLRGRVGRSKYQGYCFLMTDSNNPPSRRLRALESSSDGFALADLDLELRGPGAIYGTLQHGALDLNVASLTDSQLIADARKAAEDFIARNENLLKYKELSKRIQKLRTLTLLN